MCTAGRPWFSFPRKSLRDASAAPDTRHLTPVIVGPTGVGKTAVAVALASRVPITVISADARQLYRGLDIGTAKPRSVVLARVPHRGLDLLEPGERYSAGRFARDAAGGGGGGWRAASGTGPARARRAVQRGTIRAGCGGVGRGESGGRAKPSRGGRNRSVHPRARRWTVQRAGSRSRPPRAAARVVQ